MERGEAWRTERRGEGTAKVRVQEEKGRNGERERGGKREREKERGRNCLIKQFRYGGRA